MSVPALALAPVLIDPRTGTGASTAPLDAQLLDRAGRGDYHAWLAGTTATGGCVRPVRLHGTIRDLNPATGEILRSLDTDTLPDKVIYTPCGDRRASVCPACAETYRRDTYQLIRAGLTGGKGIPATIRAHPCVFATFTAPGFGPVHTRRQLPGGRAARCRPRRKTSLCQHRRRLSCGQRHKDTDPTLGRPLCPDCYDYNAAVVWNAHAPELWRRTTIVPATADGQVPNIAVASYLAKYATKSTEAVGTIACRITADNLPFYGNTRSHQGRLIRAAWHLGSHDAPDFSALRRWAHMLGYRGHFATKSRRYSTTLRALRQARADYRRRQDHSPTPATTARPPSSPSPRWNGPGWAGALPATLCWPCPPPPGPATTTRPPATPSKPYDCS